MYEITASSHFDAAHFLRGYPGRCANIHGHRWKVEIALQGNKLNEQGILLDFMEVKNMLHEVLAVFDHQMINEIPPFDELNPTAENLAGFIWQTMDGRLRDQIGDQIKITRVTVWESPAAGASYFGRSS